MSERCIWKNNFFYLFTSFQQKTECQRIYGSLWSKANHCWKYPANNMTYKQIRNLFPLAVFSNMDKFWEQQQKTNNYQNLKRVDILQPDNIKTQMWPHQLRAFNFFKDQRQGALFMYMGTGKTLTALAIMDYKGPVNVIIVCPNNAVYVWPEQILLHLKKNIYKIHILSGNKSIKKCSEEYKDAITTPKNIFIINYERIWRGELGEMILKNPPQMVICDESQKIKSSKASVTKFMKKLSNVEYRFILTGTPQPHDLLDYFGQFLFLAPWEFGKSFVAFRNRYAVYGGYLNKQIIRFQNQDELLDKVSKYSFTIRTDEVQKLPKVIDTMVPFELGETQKKAYEDFMNQEVLNIDLNVITASCAVSKIWKMRELCSGFVKNEGEDYLLKENSKLAILKELIDQIPLDKKIVIFTFFIHDTKLLVEELKAVQLSGQAKELQKFQEGNERIIVIQIQSGSEGIDLTMANYVIYYSPTVSYKDYAQSYKRVHRPGQNGTVYYYYLTGKGTIEKSMWLKLFSTGKDIDSLELLREEKERRREKNERQENDL